jgi:hypothetical protein
MGRAAVLVAGGFVLSHVSFSDIVSRWAPFDILHSVVLLEINVESVASLELERNAPRPVDVNGVSLWAESPE